MCDEAEEARFVFILRFEGQRGAFLDVLLQRALTDEEGRHAVSEGIAGLFADAFDGRCLQFSESGAEIAIVATRHIAILSAITELRPRIGKMSSAPLACLHPRAVVRSQDVVLDDPQLRPEHGVHPVLPRPKRGIAQGAVDVVRQQRQDGRLVRQRGEETPRGPRVVVVSRGRRIGIRDPRHPPRYLATSSLPRRPGGIAAPVRGEGLPSRPRRGPPRLAAIVDQPRRLLDPSRLEEHQARAHQSRVVRLVVGREEGGHVHGRGRTVRTVVAIECGLEGSVGVK
mmetsp:Transcript_1707/g.3939  ORF Transcript_1707/g.3939 Transcript_1707/m.3939 type:complete len:284 (-) Transcript_1707:558-1409(-)